MQEAEITHAPDFETHGFDSTMSPCGLKPVRTEHGTLIPAARVATGEMQIEGRGDFVLLSMSLPGGGIYYCYTPDGARRLADWLHQAADIIDGRAAHAAREMLDGLRAQDGGEDSNG